MSRLPTLALHPFLFALYPILLLYSRNADSLWFSATFPSILLVEVLTLGGLVLLRRVWGDVARAGLTLAAILFVVFSFERNVHSWQSHHWPGTPDTREWGVLLLALGGLGAWVKLLRIRPRFASTLQTMANAASVALIGMLVPALLHAAQPADPVPAQTQPKPWATLTSRPSNRPDIYFIVLDAYGRSDVLRSVIGYDNRAWLDRMTRKGFYLASQSTANYCQTALSITATLNGQYHDELAGSAAKSRLPLRAAIQTTRFPRFLQEQGYRLIGFASGFGLTDDFPADQRWGPGLNLPEFAALLLDMTPVPTVLGGGAGRLEHQLHRGRILYLLDNLPEVALDPEPTFCLAHVVGPHPPFVFGAEGQDISAASPTYRLTDGTPWSDLEGHGDSADYAQHYRAQAAYLSARVEAVVDQILARSPVPPVIVIQGDHGAGSHFDPDCAQPNDLAERMSILNLILLPGARGNALRPDITPVNTFRIISDQVLGTHLGTLPERNYYSSYQAPYRLVDVTDQVSGHSDQ